MKAIMKTLQINLKKNMPTILSFLACGGVIGTAVLAVKNQEKAKSEMLNHLITVEGESIDIEKPLTEKEKAKIYIKAHIPTALMGVATMACILGSNKLNRNQQAALISAYGLLNESYKDYRNKVIEFHGEEEHKKILKSIAAEKANVPYINSPGAFSAPSLNAGEYSKNDKEQLFYDYYSKRFFTSTLAAVIQAEYHINRNWCLGAIVLLNDWYDFLGISQTIEGNELGWYICAEDEYFWLDFTHEPGVLEDGTEYIIISMDYEPSLKWQGEQPYYSEGYGAYNYV